MKNKNNHDSEKLYYEYIAKQVIEHYFPLDFMELVKKESPDYVDANNKGLEITRVFFPKEGKASNFFNQIIGKSVETVDKNSLQKFYDLGYELSFHPITKRIIGFYHKEAIWQNNKEIMDIFMEKLEKHYKIKTDLFVFSPMSGWYDDDDIKEIVTWMHEQQTNSNNRFNYVYVFDYKSIYKCNLNTCSFEKTLLSEDLIRNIVERSLSMYYH